MLISLQRTVLGIYMYCGLQCNLWNYFNLTSSHINIGPLKSKHEALFQTEPHYSIVINLHQLALSFIKFPLISFLATDTVMSLASIPLDHPYFKLQ